MYIYNLICEDAGGLGGPMGSEHTDYIFTQPCSSLKVAKAYAEKYRKKNCKGDWPKYAEWESQEKGRWFVDSGAYIFTIERREVL